MRHAKLAAERVVWRMLHDHADVSDWTAAQVEAAVQHFTLEVEILRAEASLGHGVGIRCNDAACAPCAMAVCPLGLPSHFMPSGCECGAT